MQLAASGVEIAFAGRPVLQNVSLTLHAGQKWGVLGRNGSGKTTLVRVLAGQAEPSAGTVARASGLRVTLLDQHREFPNATSVWDAAAAAFADLRRLEKSLEQQAHDLGSATGDSEARLKRYDRDLEQFNRMGGYEYSARVDAVLDGLGFDHEHARTQSLTHLSGGERGRLALAQQLVSPADILILDEPTNHLDIDTTRWLETYLKQIDATVMVISHDRAFLAAVADHMLHIAHGTATPYDSGYEAFVQIHAERARAQQKAFDVQQKMIAAEEDYIRRNIAGQNTKQAQGRRTRLARLPRLTPPASDNARTPGLRLEPRARGGNQVLVADHASIAVDNRVLIKDFTARIERGDVIGLIGANGSGKSTLLRSITGERTVQSGTIRIGDSLDVAYYRQDLAQVPNGITLFDIVHDLRPLWERGQVMGHLGRFGFSGDASLRTADNLSGGERARVALAILMLSHANFLMLDEPTNHLDVESIEALEDAVADFDGTILLVSHDRALLTSLTTRIWHLENQRIEDFNGAYDEWQRARDEAAARIAREEDARAQEQRDRDRLAARKREREAKQARASQRELRDAVRDAEAQIERLESRAAEIRTRLEDNELYATSEGAREATQLSVELKLISQQMDDALDEWTRVTELLESRARGE